MKTTAPTVEARLKTLIATQLGIDETEITSNAHFVDDLGADSLDKIEICIDIENEFGLPEIDEEFGDRFTTFKDVLDHVEAELAKK